MSGTVDVWAVRCLNSDVPAELLGIFGIYPTESRARAVADGVRDGRDWRVQQLTVPLPPDVAEVLEAARAWRAMFVEDMQPPLYAPEECALSAAVDAWLDGDR